jgi:RimJ/RimL family protein N-acetyltransferase
MSRALRPVLAWGFELPGVEVVQWRAQVGNWASRRVACRCGFRIEGTVPGLLEQRGERRDSWIGSLRRGDPMTGQPDGPPHSG